MPRSQPDQSPVAENPGKNVTTSTVPVSHIAARQASEKSSAPGNALAVEIGGRDGPEPTRFGDWEKRGRCIDF
jgi:hypothetical protein